MNENQTREPAKRPTISERAQLLVEAPAITGRHAVRWNTPQARRVDAIVAKVRGAK